METVFFSATAKPKNIFMLPINTKAKLQKISKFQFAIMVREVLTVLRISG